MIKSIESLRRLIKKFNSKLNIAYCRAGYYYFYSDDEALANKLCALKTTSVYVFNCRQLSKEQWIEEVEAICNTLQKDS